VLSAFRLRFTLTDPAALSALSRQPPSKAAPAREDASHPAAGISGVSNRPADASPVLGGVVVAVAPGFRREQPRLFARSLKTENADERLAVRVGGIDAVTSTLQPLEQS
jgi:hypothetical protein